MTRLLAPFAVGLVTACAAPAAQTPQASQASLATAPSDPRSDGPALPEPACPGPDDPVAIAERADHVLLVRAAPRSAPREVETEEALRALTRPAREDRTGPLRADGAVVPQQTDGLTYRVMSVIGGPATASDVVRLPAPPLGCPRPSAGRDYLLMLGPGEAAAASPISGADDPLVARARLVVR